MSQPPIKIFLSSRASGKQPPGIGLVIHAVKATLDSISKRHGIETVLLHEHILPGDAPTDEPSDIQSSHLIIADISGADPEVMWQVGFAQAHLKPVLLLCQDVGDIPNSLRQHRIVLYQPTSASSIGTRLFPALEYMLNELGHKDTKHAKKKATPRRRVFISYSHADQEFLYRILVHLRPLEREGLIDLWSDTNLRAGDKWREEIREALAKAQIAIMLISADFLASDFITTNELPPLLRAAELQGMRVIPIIIKPSRFLREKHLSRFQAINNPSAPIVRMSEADREDLYAKLAETIESDLYMGEEADSEDD